MKTVKIFLLITLLFSMSCNKKESQVTENSLSLRSVDINTNFYGDWESGLVTNKSANNWEDVEEVAPDRITLLNDGGARQGNYYARVEVRPGDNPLTCCSLSSRAEVSGLISSTNTRIYENLNSGTQQYSFSVKFDTTWQPMVNHNDGEGTYGSFLQLHGPNGTNPDWMLSATDMIRFHIRSGDITKNKGTYFLISNPFLNKGKWIDFKITIKYTKDSTGFVLINRRDEGQTDFTEVVNMQNIPTLQYDPNINNGTVGDHYMKYGLYRNDQTFTSILYLDGFTRSSVTTVANTTTYYNTQVSACATKNDCPTGYTGSIVTYTVNAGTYSSTTSQTDADSKATTDLNNNKQSYANANGTCTATTQAIYYNTQMSATATKNDCPKGSKGSVVTYTVAANTYSSTISLADANLKASNDLAINKQAYANANGACTYNKKH